jgi:hypothetical protein
MPGKSKNRRTRKGGRGPRGTLSLSQSENFDRQLATRSDMITVKDRTLTFLVSGTTGAGTASAVGLLPALSVSFGSRLASIAANYSRYRIVKMIIRYVPACGTTTSGRVALGILDDASGDVGTVPATVPSISALRCSRLIQPFKDTEFEYKPVDPMKWYYLVDIAGQDQRFVIQATFLSCGDLFASTTTAGSVELLYTVQFDGAFSSEN